MLYKIYYELENGNSDFFLMVIKNIDKAEALIQSQVKLRQGKFLYYEKVFITSN